MHTFLETIQADLPPDEWKIDCTRLAPYTPQENPVEDPWLKGKTFVRTHALWVTDLVGPDGGDAYNGHADVFVENSKDVMHRLNAHNLINFKYLRH